jgi:hypothetical protein
VFRISDDVFKTALTLFALAVGLAPGRDAGSPEQWRWYTKPFTRVSNVFLSSW